MRDFGKVETGFWQNRKVRKLSERGRLLMLYLYACPHGNSVGCFVLPLQYISADLQWDMETVSQTVSETVSKGFLKRDDDAELIRIVGWWEHNSIDNPKHATGALNAFARLPRAPLLFEAIRDFLESGGKHVAAISETVLERYPKLFRNTETETETETSPSREEEGVTESESKALGVVVPLDGGRGDA